MFLIGAIFVIVAYVFDPQKNCSPDGECAPWLVPIFFVMGAAVGLGGLGRLMANPNSGSCIDPATGRLIWWQNRYGTSGGDRGSIDPMEISLIRIDRRRESADEVHMYDRGGDRQFFFDEEVIGWDHARWTDALTARWPHIRVEVLD